MVFVRFVVFFAAKILWMVILLVVRLTLAKVKVHRIQNDHQKGS
jgi:hypothetical protein